MNSTTYKQIGTVQLNALTEGSTVGEVVLVKKLLR